MLRHCFPVEYDKRVAACAAKHKPAPQPPPPRRLAAHEAHAVAAAEGQWDPNQAQARRRPPRYLSPTQLIVDMCATISPLFIISVLLMFLIAWLLSV